MADTMTPKERVIAAINLEEPDRVPCSIMFNYFVARWAGVTIAEYINDIKLQADLAREYFEKLGAIDAVQVMPPGLSNDPINRLTFMPIKMKIPGKDEDMDPNSIPQYDEFELMPADGYDMVIEKGWARFVKEDLVPRAFPDYAIEDSQFSAVDDGYDPKSEHRFYEEKNVFLYSGIPLNIPFEMFSFSRSMEKFTVDLYRRPEKVIAAMDAIMPELLDQTITVIKDSRSPVFIPTCRGSNGFISPGQFERFVFPQLKVAVETVVSHGSPVYFHLDQKWTKFLPYFREFPEGRYVLHFDGATDIFKAKEVIGDRMCIMGDVPAPLFVVEGPDEVRGYCRKLIDVIGKGGGFILASGCTVPDNAKFENVKAMIDIAKTYHPPRQ